ncbi:MULTISPECIES: hypothetical protein [unclassified Ornithinimicrobium]|uniref:hypothetical protein n=1 Tax=unclassified Ornithinimicrobium TaxID=2615080 RepID=UPI0038542808
MRHRHRAGLSAPCTTLLLVGLSAGALVLGACGSATDTPAAPSTDEDPAGTHVRIVRPGEELVAHGILMQTAPERVEICLGGVAESYPPQCDGPVLRGDFSWDDVSQQRSGTVTWTDDPVFAVGTFDADDGDTGSFTLARAISTGPPPGYAVPAPQEPAFPQLCDDPYRDGAEGPPDQAEQEALRTALEDLDGYVTSWVSDGSHLYNVVVTSDPEQAHDQLREVWSGGLCVVERDLPTQDRLRAAQEALSARFEEVGLLSSGSGGVTGLLDVGVVVTDQASVDAVREIVSPWLTPDQVVITGALQPMRATGTS